MGISGVPKDSFVRKGLCFENENAHHSSPGEGQGCGVGHRALEMARERAWGSRCCTPGVGLCPAGRTWRGEPLCPPAFLSRGGKWRLLKSWVGPGCPVRGCCPVPPSPTPAAGRLCLLQRERFAAQRTEPKIPLLRPCYCPRRSPGLPTLTTLIQENSPGGPGALGGTEGGFTWSCFCTNLSHR